MKKRANRYHHGDLRSQLIEATRQLVEEKGPDHLSVSAASRLAGVSTAAPYKHFKDKDDLLRAVALGGMSRQHQQMQDALAPLPPRSLDRIVALGQVYVAFAQAEPAVFRLMFGLSEDHGDDAALMTKGDEIFSMVKSEVAAYRGSETVADQDELRAFQLWSYVHGLSFLLIDGKVGKMEIPIGIDQLLTLIARQVMDTPV